MPYDKKDRLLTFSGRNLPEKCCFRHHNKHSEKAYNRQWKLSKRHRHLIHFLRQLLPISDLNGNKNLQHKNRLVIKAAFSYFCMSNRICKSIYQNLGERWNICG